MTTTNLINSFPLDTPSPLFFHPKFKEFVQQHHDDIPTISNSVVDPLHPVPEPYYLSCGTIFDGWFGISSDGANYLTHVRSPHPTKSLRLYSLTCLIPLYLCTLSALQIRTLVLHVFPLQISHHIAQTFLSDAVPPAIPPPLYLCTLSALQIRTLVLHVLPLQISHHIAQTFLSDAVPPAIPPPTHLRHISNCFTLYPLPVQHNWEEAYQKYSETKLFLDHLSINAPLDQSTIRTLPAAYRTAISRNQIGFFSSRLVYYEQISFSHKHICRIVVPLSLCRNFFVLMHASPVAGHMGEYTFIPYSSSFFLPRMRADIKDWIQQCPNCILTCRWPRRGQELMFSWPIISSFAILHVDLWSPRHMTNQNGYIALMNTMYDIIQFVLVVPVPDETSATLASHSMQHVLLKFGMCRLVVIDDGTPFKGTFVAMCQALNLNYEVLVKHNQKDLSVEHFHRFLNKSVTIAVEDRGTNDIFVPASIAAAYAWNSASIDGTDIIRSVPAIGQALNFPLDINLNTVSKLIQNNAQATLNYLNFINFYRHFASSILKILTEDCQTAHAKRINNSKNLILLKAGDIVMARTSI